MCMCVRGEEDEKESNILKILCDYFSYLLYNIFYYNVYNIFKILCYKLFTDCYRINNFKKMLGR